MDISKSINGSTVTLKLSGRIDTMTSIELGKELDTLFQNGDNSFVFDFSEIDYISSAGLRVLLTAQKRVNALGTKMKITGVTPLVKEIFDITGFSAIIEME